MDAQLPDLAEKQAALEASIGVNERVINTALVTTPPAFIMETDADNLVLVSSVFGKHYAVLLPDTNLLQVRYWAASLGPELQSEVEVRLQSATQPSFEGAPSRETVVESVLEILRAWFKKQLALSLAVR